VTVHQPDPNIVFATVGGGQSAGVGYYDPATLQSYGAFWGAVSITSETAGQKKIVFTLDDTVAECDASGNILGTGMEWTPGGNNSTLGPYKSTDIGGPPDQIKTVTFSISATTCYHVGGGVWEMTEEQRKAQSFQPAPMVLVAVRVPVPASGFDETNAAAWAKSALGDAFGISTARQGLQIQQQGFTNYVNLTRRNAAATHAGMVFEVFAESNEEIRPWVELAKNPSFTFEQKYFANGGASGATVQTAVAAIPVANNFKASAGQQCSSHFDCQSSLFCSTYERAEIDAPTCEVCGSCIDGMQDSVDESCPQDLCPGSGGYPPCVDAKYLALLFEANGCQSSYQFNVWRFTQKTQNADTGAMEYVAPSVVPVYEPTARTVTPFNRLVGGIGITQERRRQESCIEDNIPRNVFIDDFSEAAKVTCPAATLDNATFGYDPSFMPSSSLYNGKLSAADWYSLVDRHVKSTTVGNVTITTPSFPKGFFPHSYFQKLPGEEFNYTTKPTHTGSEDLFKLFLDERLTGTQAKRAIQFAKDGKFLDGSTSSVEVDFITYNADLDQFAQARFFFDWSTSGKIPWNFNLQTVSIHMYQARSQEVLWRLCQAVVVVCLVVNCVMEIMDILVEIRKFQLISYFRSPYNWVDWAHFICMWATVFSWIIYEEEIGRFTMLTSYPIIKTVGSPARVFATEADIELEFLNFQDRIRSLSSGMDTYSTFSGISVIIFVFRMLKGLNFQERMGLVTRTLEAAISDLLHFFALFGVVFMGYACVGVLLFGHQFKGMSDFHSSCLTLVVFLISFDATQFYASMSHAANEWAFHLFLWSYLIVAFFILLNIFLAILVDAYAAVKQSTQEAAGLPDELKMVALHGIKRRFMDDKRFVSDQQLLKVLERLRDNLRGTQKLKTEVKQALSHRQAVLLPGGVELDNIGMARIAKEAGAVIGHKSSSTTASGKVMQSDSIGKEEVQASIDNEQREVMELAQQDVVLDLMARFGQDVGQRSDQHNSDVLDLVQMENLRNQLCMFNAQGKMLKEQERVIGLMEVLAHGSVPDHVLEEYEKAAEEDDMQINSVIGKVHVHVVRGERLPKMDMFRDCDPYLITYLDSAEKDEVHRTHPQRKERNPKWGEETRYSWDLLNMTKWLTITVMDKDQVTKDDIIGCVNIDITALPFDQEMTKWYQLENPAMTSKVRESKIQVSVLKASLGAEADQSQSNGAAELVSPNISHNKTDQPPDTFPDPAQGPPPEATRASAELEGGVVEKAGTGDVAEAGDVVGSARELEDSLNLSTPRKQ